MTDEACTMNRVGKQIVNVPSFVVRLDSQKVRHFTLASRLVSLGVYSSNSTLTLPYHRHSVEEEQAEQRGREQRQPQQLKRAVTRKRRRKSESPVTNSHSLNADVV